mmetsp:Transcript_19350/g.74304  ORF Transcript_19350/g.74304 Transcript_19350/m.74304 type:complete len:613 (+) Transcript_19350:308-2146(+)
MASALATLRLQVDLPNKETAIYDVEARSTIDKAKALVFRTTPSLAGQNMKDYIFTLKTSRKLLHVEFFKLVDADPSFQDCIQSGKPIEVVLLSKDAVHTPSAAAVSRPFTSPPPSHPAPAVPGAVSNSLPISGSPPVPSSPLSGKASPKAKKKDRKHDLLGVVSPELRRRKSRPDSPGGRQDAFRRAKSSMVGRSGGSGRFKALFKATNSISQPNCSNDIIVRPEQQATVSDSDKGTTFEPLPMEALGYTWADTAEWPLIAIDQFGFHSEVGNKALDPKCFGREYLVLEVPKQEHLYNMYFVDKDHSNYAGFIENIGPCVVSIVEDKESNCTRALVRIPHKTQKICIDASSSGLFSSGGISSLKTVLGKTANPAVPKKNLKKIKNPDLVKELAHFDGSHIVLKYKFGVLYCKEGQTTEEEWFGNEHGSPGLDRFLSIIGDKIKLQGWEKFRGGLDVNGNSTGEYSVFTDFKGYEIMFHVSTLLPFMPADEQKIERKRHLGNDIVVIIFKEGNTPFPPAICKSVFNHTYIVVQEWEDPNYYQISVTTKDGVKAFGPPFPFPPIIHVDMLREFLLTKMLNAEWAAYRSLEFSHKFKRTRKQQLTAMLKGFEVEP